MINLEHLSNKCAGMSTNPLGWIAKVHKKIYFHAFLKISGLLLLCYHFQVDSARILYASGLSPVKKNALVGPEYGVDVQTSRHRDTTIVAEHQREWKKRLVVEFFFGCFSNNMISVQPVKKLLRLLIY